MNRRGFLRSLSRATVAALAAPVIAPVVIEALTPPVVPVIDFSAMHDELFKIARNRGDSESIEVWTDEKTARDFQEAFEHYYRSKVTMEEAA